MKHCSQCQLLFADDRQVCPQDNTPLRMVEDLQPGMIVRGKYHIVERIGMGGMAAVYRARHELLNEDRAIKVVLPKYSSDKDFLKRFRHEAALARKLRHDNAVWVENLDQMEDGRPFMAMEYLRGRDLRGLIRKEGPLSVERTLTLAAQVASALSAAHELGIIHRDIKPDNIFVITGKRGDEVAKVLDFGIAKALEGTAESGYTATKTGMIVGTPAYMSPEQARGGVGNKLDRRSDIYSLGMVIYEMLAGRVPFESDTPMDMLFHQVHTKPQPPHEMRPDLRIPEPVSMVLMKALEKSPEKRFQTADEMVDALRNPSQWATMVGLAKAPVPVAPTKVVAAAASANIAAPVPPKVQPVQTPQQKPQIAEQSPQLLRKHTVDLPKKRLQSWMLLGGAALLVVFFAVVFSRSRSSDAYLQAEIERQFHASDDSALHDGQVKVFVSEGVATLEGTVFKAAEKDLAARIATDVSRKDSINMIVVQAAAATATVAPPNPARTSTHQANDQPVQPTIHNTDGGSSAVSGLRNQFNRGVNGVNTAGVQFLVSQGNRQRDNGDYKGARTSFHAALKMDPRNAEALSGLSKTDQAEADEEKAILQNK